MKMSLSFAAKLFLLSGLFWMSSCEGCQETLDKFIRESMIPIPTADRTPPTIWFEVTDTGTNTTQTFTTNADITKNNGDHLKIVLWGEDADGGVKKLCLAHGFRSTCCSTSGSPQVCVTTQTLGVNQCQDFSNLTTHAFKKWFILSDLDISLGCGEGYRLSSGGYSLTGTVENFHGGQASISLSISVQ